MNIEGNKQVKDETTAPANGERGPTAAGAQAEMETLVEAPNLTIATAELEELKAEAAKAKEHWDKLVRTAADFDNFKKRAARERQDAVKYANESLMEKLVPVLDNFEMAMAATNAPQAGSAQSLQAGVSMIQQQLKRVLTEAGLEEIIASNQPFDPNVHEAVSQQATTDVPEGQVVQQLRKGYKLRDRLIRPATVVVAKHPDSQ